MAVILDQVDDSVPDEATADIHDEGGSVSVQNAFKDPLLVGSCDISREIQYQHSGRRPARPKLRGESYLMRH
jgi:hypothetical protein